MKDVIFFDLDGTLTKSEEGIIRCVQYALRELGMPVPAKKDLFYFIGPPLVDSFLTLPGFTEAMALEATACTGNATLQLASLKMNCTQALRTYWRRLMRQVPACYGIGQTGSFCASHYRSFWPYALFSGNWRCFLRCSRRTKSAVIAEVLNRLGLQKTKERVLMVGDTAYDVEGARKIGIDCVGVTYGYGKETELAAAHPLGLAATVEALKDGLLTHAFG